MIWEFVSQVLDSVIQMYLEILIRLLIQKTRNEQMCMYSGSMAEQLAGGSVNIVFPPPLRYSRVHQFEWYLQRIY